MSFISEFQCKKCDRMYTALRSKCPYCGTRRISGGKYAATNDNQSGKILIAILILSVFVVAAGVLLFTTEPEYIPEPVIAEPEPEDDLNGIVAYESENPILPQPEDNNTVTDPEDPQYDGPIIPRGLNVQSPYGRLPGDFTRSISNEGSMKLTARSEPLGVEDPILWKSSNDDIFTIVPGNLEGTEAVLYPLSAGRATLTVSVGSIEREYTVNVRR